MAEYKVDQRDILFVLFELLDMDALLGLDQFKEYDKQDIEIIFQEAVKFTETAIAPQNAMMDEKGCQLVDGKVILPKEMKELYDMFAESGWLGISHSPEFGGQGLPEIVAMACGEGFVGGNCTFSLTPMLTRGASHLIETFGNDELKNTYCEKMYSGKWAGTMCLTEAQAGSDVGATRTTATPFEDHYLIEGNKIFITSGDHDLTENIVHLVLARLPDAPPGTRGISLFCVPKNRLTADGLVFNDVRCGSIEHKMGIKGSPTCELVFGQDGECHGWLVGEPHKGMRYMFQMMNEARLEVGVQGQAMAAAAYQMALEYAKERIQGTDIMNMRDPDAPKVAIIEHPDIRRQLTLMRAWVEGLRAMMLSVGYHNDMARHHPDPKKRDWHDAMVQLLTPICKAYGSDIGFKVCDMAIQIHGGYGYCTEYGVEQYLRDVKIAAIYEGANGIQALDLLGRKMTMKKGAVFMGFILHLNSYIESQRKHPVLADAIKKLEDAKNVVAEMGMFLGTSVRKGKVKEGLQYACPYLEMFGELTTMWYLIQSAVVAHEKLEGLYTKHGCDTPEKKADLLERNSDVRFYDAKLKLVDYFGSMVLPGVAAKAQSIKALSRAALDIRFD